jgi:hypothetical protein
MICAKTFMMVRVTKINGSSSDDWIYSHIGHSFFNGTQYSAIADLHKLHLTFTHAIGSWAFNSRLLITELK